jgi:cysteine sulfinate desulfinase/cysteine desulfurase-like protein
MGLSDADAQSSLRLTMGRGTTPEQIHRTVTVLASLV